MKSQFCTFFLGDLFMGIEVEKVQEILRSHSVAPVPLAPPAVSGLINLRGQIVTAVDLRRMVNLPERGEGDAAPMNIILSAHGGSLSFVVDRVGDVVDVADEDFEKPPDTLRGSARRMIRGAYKLSGRLLLVIDSENALDVDTSETTVEGTGGTS